MAIRTGFERSQFGEHGEPIMSTSSYVFESAAEAAARFSGESEGPIYSRFTNPTVQIFEKRLAALEGGEACICLLYTSPSPRDKRQSRMPSSA